MTHLSRLAVAGLLLPLAIAASAWTPERPADLGRVVLDASSSRAGMAPVQFDHWRHRALFTCRLCHVDVGFAMAAGETRVSASSNQAGFHCGACHNGKTAHRAKPIFASCGARGAPESAARCNRCHTRGDAAQRSKDYEAFAAGMPRKGLAGGVDWEKAEASGRIKPLDYVEGVSIRRDSLAMDREITIKSRMTDVTFSHRKHAVWNGCEVCHPDIFPSNPGAARATMLQIADGESCGACHGKVAFALGDCERCHLMPVR